MATDLLSDEKETAEHRMLVDLGRNDIGRISETASVQVTKYMEVELFRYVMHLTSVVKGRLLPDLTAMVCLESYTSSWNSFRSTKDSGHETHL